MEELELFYKLTEKSKLTNDDLGELSDLIDTQVVEKFSNVSMRISNNFDICEGRILHVSVEIENKELILSQELEPI